MTAKKNIEILRVTYLRGPNIWTYRPVIEAWVDIGELEDFPSNTLPGFYERITAWLPGLIEHHCSPGVRGGFLERLREGTWAAHILEHVSLEIQNLAGMQTGFGKARQTSQRGIYKVAFRTRQEQVGRQALVVARDLVMAAINDTVYDLDAQLTTLRDQVDSLCLGPSTSNIVDAATDRRIPSIRLTEGNLVQLGYGHAQRRIWTAETDQTSAIAEEIASDKDLTKSLLKSCGVPVPEGALVNSPEAAWEAAQDIGMPVAIKPYDGNHGRGVSLELMDETSVVAAFHVAKQQSGGSVIVEKFIPGNEHRLLVVGKQVVAAARGESAWVVGDGVSSVTTLVDQQLNTDPRRGTGEDAPLNLIDLRDNPEVALELERVGLTAQSVPAKDRRVLIQRNGNVACDVTDQMHPSVAAIAALAARVVGLDIAGIDMVMEDISKPIRSQQGAVIEVNASPGLLAHIKPAEGHSRPVGKAIVAHLFAPEADGRIPVVGITGTQNTGRLARLVAWLVHISGKHVGLACSEGLYLDGRQVLATDCAHWEPSQRLLINRSVQAAVFENSSQMILGEGMAYDKCAVGVVTDAKWTPSLKDFDILDAEQTFKVARTQVDVILPTGTAVLNASDPQVVEMAELCDGKVIFYAIDATQPALAAHQAAGERVVFLRNGEIVLAQGAEEIALLPLSSLKPAKAAQPELVMAATAAAWALNIPVELIGAGLRTFDSSPKKTPY
ncbi:cyanophycin synthetase [Rhodoferax saidenbachensis]|uniref:Cyanophycin synthetase n=1 Tax=Rhodoferax saidenbachensis TaxID=1484693 RepID=A0ABU1ZJJ8_9BURK|nr:cyanophycin synthetase [Rhodoferax saidenbachensis]MDR7305553.1 cyanophycin synthetase [Rhodoferax saidenbachensis]